MEKNNFNFENARLSGKNHQSLHIYYVMRIRTMQVKFSYVRLDHTLYSINYSNCSAFAYVHVNSVFLVIIIHFTDSCGVTLPPDHTKGATLDGELLNGN